MIDMDDMMSKAQSDKLKELESKGWHRVVGAVPPGAPTPVNSPDGKRWLLQPDGTLSEVK